MKNLRFRSLLLFCVALLFLIPALCDEADESSDDPFASENACAWNGNCSSMAPEGAYDCSGESIVQCVAGQWEFVTGCLSHSNSGGYSCTCKGGCGVDMTECSFAFDICDGLEYETCGENAEAVLTDKWECVADG